MNPRRLVSFGTVWGCLILGGLVVYAAEASVETLIGDLKSPDESVRLQAIDQLGAQGAKAAEAVAPLEELLRDGSATVRAHAACCLGEIGKAAKPAVPALVELLKDSDDTVRQQAVKAVMHIRPGPRVTVPLCIKLLEDSDPGVRMRILNAISEVGDKAVPGLIVALENDKAAYWACLMLRDIGPAAKEAVPGLVKRLKDSRPEVRRESLLALAAMEEAASPAVPQIAAALDNENTAVAATYALGRIGQIPARVITARGEEKGRLGWPGSAYEFVIEPEAVVRRNAKSDDKVLSTTSLWALARVHPEDKELRREAGQRLVERLKDPDAFVRVAAARALAALPPAPEIMGPIWEKAFQEADETTVRHALDALVALGPAAVPRLIEAIKHEKAREHVVYVLGRIGPAAAPATPALAKLIADKDEHVAHEAVLALANIGPGAKDAVAALIQALPQEENSNAHAIVYALGKIGPDASAAEPVLTGLLKSPDRNLALTSAWALVQIRPASAELAAKTLPVLTAGLSDPLPLVRRGAAEALGSLGPSAREAIPALQKAISDEHETVRAAAAKAIPLIRGH